MVFPLEQWLCESATVLTLHVQCLTSYLLRILQTKLHLSTGIRFSDSLELM